MIILVFLAIIRNYEKAEIELKMVQIKILICLS